jgi:tetratricopeptide (TPR) repeat protein
VELTGFEPRRSDLARGIVIARSTRSLDDAEQRALWKLLGAAGVTEVDEPEESETATPPETEEHPEPARRWHAAPWLPPATQEIESQRVAVERAAATFEIDAMWFVKVETGIDGVAWLEMTVLEPPDEGEESEREEEEENLDETVKVPIEIVDAIFDAPAEVLYAAPDAPVERTDDDDEVAPSEETTADHDIGIIESHWRNGAPPFEHTVPFPIERYPEIIDEYSGDSFGVAFKLGGEPLAGEESVVNAFFALWLSVYQDERADELEAFQRADVIHDRRHRSALMWVEKFSVPATPADQTHFLLWIVARIHDVLPLSWARFESVDGAVKSRASGDSSIASAGGVASEPFVLAGNPFAERFHRHGEEGALAWAVSQSAWSRRELAGMLIEVALDHDPDDPTTAVVAERLLRRALAFDGESDASGYLAIVLVRQRRIADAIALARAAPSRDVRLLVVGEMAEHVSNELPSAIDLLDAETTAVIDSEDLAELTGTVARHAPASLGAVLDRMPDDGPLVPYLYNASFSVERPQALQILRKVLALPEPPREAGEARTALVMAWNNACIHAHALGDYRLAVELADGGQPFAPENPYIYHSAACAYAAVGQIDRALEQVSRAIEHEYEHTEKMETDHDLAPLQNDPRFSALFVEWRTRRADLN